MKHFNIATNVGENQHKPFVKKNYSAPPKKNLKKASNIPAVLQLHQNKFLQHIVENKKKISIKLTNMESITGYLFGYDNFSVTFVDISEDNVQDKIASPSIIFKHSIFSMKEIN